MGFPFILLALLAFSTTVGHSSGFIPKCSIILFRPVAWKKIWGKGRVFYCSLGHVASDFQTPQVLTIQTRGMIWAAEGKAAAK